MDTSNDAAPANPAGKKSKRVGRSRTRSTSRSRGVSAASAYQSPIGDITGEFGFDDPDL